MNRITHSREKGFSLAELLTTVAIISILGSVALPNFQSFRGRAKQVEAKSLLSGVYVAEQAFSAEYSAYTARFDSIGFRPSGAVHFNVGFTADFAPPPTAPPGTPSCNDLCQNNDATTVCAAGFNTWTCQTQDPAPIGLFTAAAKATHATFTAQARGHITPGQPDDLWQMTEMNSLTNLQSGL